MNLANIIAAPQSGRKQAVILDHLDYSQAVILQARPIPWSDATAYANFMGQAQGMLKPDVALLHLDRFYAHEVATNQRLREAMAAKTRTGFALRTLLADAETLQRAVSIADTFAQIQREPVVLQVPSPRQWLAATHPFSGKEDVAELNADDAENASMYLADWLRNFSALPVAGVLLDDRKPSGAGELCAVDLPDVDLEVYTPVINVAENYRWTLGSRRENAMVLREADTQCEVLDGGFWTAGAPSLPTAGFFFSELPATAVPEDVIARIADFS